MTDCCAWFKRNSSLYSLEKLIEWKLIQFVDFGSQFSDSLLAREINWMETRVSIANSPAGEIALYSLEKLIEWKLDKQNTEETRLWLSLLAREINWMETRGKCSPNKNFSFSLYSLEKLIEWKPVCLSHFWRNRNLCPSLLAREINWMETMQLDRRTLHNIVQLSTR